MKIFHTENGKEVVYVQRQDIYYIERDLNIAISGTIFNKVFTRVVNRCNASNRFDFIRFEDEKDVKFFKKLEFIIDYDKYKDFTEEQFEKEENKLISKLNELAEILNEMEDNEIANSTQAVEYSKLEHMLNFLYEIYFVKYRGKTMAFPEFVKQSEKD